VSQGEKVYVEGVGLVRPEDVALALLVEHGVSPIDLDQAEVVDETGERT
jgi:hypothetical protein